MLNKNDLCGARKCKSAMIINKNPMPAVDRAAVVVSIFGCRISESPNPKAPPPNKTIIVAATINMPAFYYRVRGNSRYFTADWYCGY